MIALRREWVAIGYDAYLLVLALAIKRFALCVVRRPLRERSHAVSSSARSRCAIGSTIGRITFSLVIPLVILLVGYWLSGCSS